MIRLTDLALPLDHEAPALEAAVLAKLGIAQEDLVRFAGVPARQLMRAKKTRSS